MKVNDFSWKVAGAAGDGILSAGMLFAKTCMRGGLNVMATAEYPSLIRGGHNHLDVRVKSEHVNSHSKHIDLLIALNQDAMDYHSVKLVAGGAIIYDDSEVDTKNAKMEKGVNLFAVPLKKIADEHGGTIMKNTIAMGATIGLLNFDLELFYSVLGERFGKKGEAIIEQNKKAARAGYDFVKQYAKDFSYKLEKQERKNTMMITGNESLSAGAIKAGCKFYSAYPMTPASSILHYMAGNAEKFDIVVKHTEDEIAAINNAIGASYAGVRSMCGTSGGGFSLMVESLGLAAMTETPLVVVEAQRPGPASGMATHSGQADLRFVMHAGTDEFPRILMAPGDVEECFRETVRVFNLAEKYQVPGIIITDKFLGESYWSTPVYDTNIKVERQSIVGDGENVDDYKRYRVTDTGVSPRAIPGTKNCMHVASSYEHDEKGMEREEEPIRVAMHNKRFRKTESIEKELPKPELVGDAKAPITIVAWGSTKGPIREAMKMLEKDGIKMNYLQFLYLSPFPMEDAKKILSKSKTIVDIECNKTGQFAGLLREHTGIEVDYKILKYDGRAFTPEDLAKVLKDIANKKAKKVIDVNGYSEEEMKQNLNEVKMRTFKLSE